MTRMWRKGKRKRNRWAIRDGVTLYEGRNRRVYEYRSGVMVQLSGPPKAIHRYAKSGRPRR